MIFNEFSMFFRIKINVIVKACLWFAEAQDLQVILHNILQSKISDQSPYILGSS